MIGCARAVSWVMRVVVLCALGAPVQAEFHTWIDSAGHRHISNVPPPGSHANDAGQSFRHPNAIAAQHRRLRETLARRDAELARRAARRGENYNRDMKANRDVPR